jgi:hypothetical protein
MHLILSYVWFRQGLVLYEWTFIDTGSWLPTVVARVRARIWSCGICDGQSGAGAGFLRVLRFPLPISIPPIAPQSSSSIIWGLYNRPEVAAVRSGLSSTPLKKKDTGTQIFHTLYSEYPLIPLPEIDILKLAFLLSHLSSLFSWVWKGS